jgi:hypothetical protein
VYSLGNLHRNACCSQSRVAGFGYSLFSIDRAALPGCRGQTRIRCDLPSVFKVSGIAPPTRVWQQILVRYPFYGK